MLGILGAPLTSQGEADCRALTGPWRRVCLPSRFTAASAYGRHTQAVFLAALSVLRHAAGMPVRSLRAMADDRAGIDEPAWQQAVTDVDAASVEAGFPYRARCLYWEAVAGAEQAAGQSPTDRGLVDALWGAAATQMLAGQLTPPTVTLLCRPYRASAAVLSPLTPQQRETTGFAEMSAFQADQAHRCIDDVGFGFAICR